MSRWRAKIFWGWRGVRTRAENRLWARTEPARRRLHTSYRRWLLNRDRRSDERWARRAALATWLARPRVRRRAAGLAAVGLAAAGLSGAVVSSSGPADGGEPQPAQIAVAGDEEGEGQVLAGKERATRTGRDHVRRRSAGPLPDAGTAAVPTSAGYGAAGDGSAGTTTTRPGGEVDSEPTGRGRSGAPPASRSKPLVVPDPRPESSPRRTPTRPPGGGETTPLPAPPETVTSPAPPPAPVDTAPPSAPVDTVPLPQEAPEPPDHDDGGAGPPGRGGDGPPGHGDQGPGQRDGPEEEPDRD